MPDLTTLEDRAYSSLIAREKAYYDAVAKSLNDALIKIRGAMQNIYDKYAIEGLLTKAEMTKYNRYVSMEQEMLTYLNEAINKNISTIKRLTPDQYNAAFFHSAWAIDNASGVRLAWGTLNMDVILETLANEFTKISLKRYGPEARLAVRGALNEGLTLGKSYQDMARHLKRAIDTTYWKALRIIRTEGQYATMAGTDDAYTRAIKHGIDGVVIWDATLDGRTRPDHGAMDGKERQEDGFFNGPGGERTPYPGWEGLSAGQRINCRCRIRMQVKDYSPALRRTRDQGIIPYETYDSWIINYKKRYGGK